MAAPRPSRALSSFICQSCLRRSPAHSQKRLLSSTPTVRADSGAPSTPESSSPPTASSQQGGSLGSLGTAVRKGSRTNKPSFADALDGRADAGSLLSGRNFGHDVTTGPHRLHVYATKHNTHLTLVQAPRPASETAGAGSGGKGSAADANKMVDVLMSMSAGNIGFKKSGRNSFDAAYQLTGYFLTQIRERGMLRDIENVEIVLRGFGAGREAVQKVILAPEGRIIRQKISAVLDATRIKHGGTRGKKPRRLG